MRLLSPIIAFIFFLNTFAFAGEKVFFYHTDPAGSPIAMTDSIGNVVWTADYKPFGEEQSTPGIIDNNREFVGKEKDTESGMSYFGARYMRSEIGRFISPDPVSAVDPHSNKTNEALLTNPQRLNTYAYGLNNPYRYIDSDGRFVQALVPILVALGLIQFGEMAFPQTMESPHKDSFIDKHGADLLTMPLGMEYESAQMANTIIKNGTTLEAGAWAKMSGMLRDAASGKGNFGIGSASREEAEVMGRAWVGEGYTVAKDGKTLISADGMRQYRPPTFKPNLGKAQANFERRYSGQTTKQWQSNGHLDITN